MKYILLNWTCEYDGHYNLDVEVNQIENNDVPGNLIEVRFRLKGGSDAGYTVLSVNCWFWSIQDVQNVLNGWTTSQTGHRNILYPLCVTNIDVTESINLTEIFNRDLSPTCNGRRYIENRNM